MGDIQIGARIDSSYTGCYARISAPGYTTVTVTAGNEGYLAIPANSGIVVTVTATAGSGFAFSRWMVNGQLPITDNPVTLTAKGTSALYYAEFTDAPITYTVRAGYRPVKPDWGYIGSIDCNPREVSPGGSSTITVETDEDLSSEYEIDYLVIHTIAGNRIDETPRGQQTYSFEIPDIQSEVVIDGYWRTKATVKYPVRASVDGGCTATGTGEYSPGETVNLVFTASPGYHLKECHYGQDSSLPGYWAAPDDTTRSKTFTIANIQGEWVYDMSSEMDETVSWAVYGEVNDPSYGSIRPASAAVTDGGSQTFTATPNLGYVLSHWIVNGSRVEKAGNSYTITNVHDDGYVRAVFMVGEVVKTITLYRGIRYDEGDNYLIEDVNLKNGPTDTTTVPGMTFKDQP